MVPTESMTAATSRIVNSRPSGRPIRCPANTSSGATKIAICIDEPTAIASARSIWFRIAIWIAVEFSAALPTSARTTTPMKTSPSPSVAPAASTAPTRNSAITATPHAAASSVPTLRATDQPGPSPWCDSAGSTSGLNR